MADLTGVWRYDTSEVIAAPASGYLRTGPAPVTQMAVSAVTTGAADVHANLMTLTTGATLIVQEVNDATKAAKFQLTAAPVDHTTWVELAVTLVAYAPAQGPPRKNEDLLVNGVAAAVHGPYVDVTELQRVLQKMTPTAAELDAMNRVLDAAAQEIDWDLSYTADNPAPAGHPILADVNLNRAEELWRFNYSAVGVLPIGPEATPIVAPRDTWYRHHLRLNPLRTAFPVA